MNGTTLDCRNMGARHDSDRNDQRDRFSRDRCGGGGRPGSGPQDRSRPQLLRWRVNAAGAITQRLWKGPRFPVNRDEIKPGRAKSAFLIRRSQNQEELRLGPAGRAEVLGLTRNKGVIGRRAFRKPTDMLQGGTS
jgi:hypothetical protein